jgi:hypothetical protein
VLSVIVDFLVSKEIVTSSLLRCFFDMLEAHGDQSGVVLTWTEVKYNVRCDF